PPAVVTLLDRRHRRTPPRRQAKRRRAPPSRRAFPPGDQCPTGANSHRPEVRVRRRGTAKPSTSAGKPSPPRPNIRAALAVPQAAGVVHAEQPPHTAQRSP